VPEAASSLMAPQMMGYHRAAEALLLGEPFMAEAALEVGLVNRIVPPTEANAVAQALAAKLAAKPLSSLVETKRLMKLGQAPLVQARMPRRPPASGACCVSRQPAKRSPPSWKNASPISASSDLAHRPALCGLA